MRSRRVRCPFERRYLQNCFRKKFSLFRKSSKRVWVTWIGSSSDSRLRIEKTNVTNRFLCKQVANRDLSHEAKCSSIYRNRIDPVSRFLLKVLFTFLVHIWLTSFNDHWQHHTTSDCSLTSFLKLKKLSQVISPGHRPAKTDHQLTGLFAQFCY